MISFDPEGGRKTPKISKPFREAIDAVVGDVLAALKKSDGAMEAYSVENVYREGVRKTSKFGEGAEALILAKLGKHFGKDFSDVRQCIYNWSLGKSED